MADWWGAYVGLPFGEGPGEVTCWRLVRAVYADRLGVALPSYGEISAADLMRIAHAMDKAAAADAWSPVAVPEALDVVLMRSGRGGQRVVHVGVMVDGSRMLHVERATHAVVVPLTLPTLRARVAGFRRWVG